MSEFGEPTQVAVSEIAVGDFVVRIDTQQRVAGRDIRSTVVEIAPDFSWVAHMRRRRLNVPARSLSFVTGEPISRPDEFTAIVRRAS